VCVDFVGEIFQLSTLSDDEGQRGTGVIMKTITLVLMYGMLAAYAQNKAATKKPEPLHEGYALNPVVATDFGCAEDYVKALNASGVQKRKMSADLLAFGCVRVMKGLFHITPHDRKPAGETSVINASLSFDLNVQERALIPLTIEQTPGDDSADREIDGWIIESQYYQGTADELVKSWRESHNLRPEKGH
jgi:hypothetical protein